MSVRLRNNKWTVDFYTNGRKEKRIILTLPRHIKTKDEALLWEKEYKQIQKEEVLKPSSRSSISQMSEMFFEYCNMHKAKSTTRDIKSCFKNHILPMLGHIRADSISLTHFHNYKKTRIGQGASNISIIKEIAYIGSFYKWGKSYGYLPGLNFRIEKLPYKRPIPIILSFDEIISFIRACSPAIYRVFFLLIYNCGLRINEARNLKWKNVDLENRSIIVLVKGGNEKRIPFGSWLFNEFSILRDSPAGAPARSEYIFISNRTGKPIQDVRKAIARAKSSTGITKRIHTHLLRHTFATHLLDKNVDIRIVQKMLGHAKITTTEWYTQVSMNLKKEASNKLLP